MKEEDLNTLLRLAIQKGELPLELDDATVDSWLARDMAGVAPAVPSKIKRLVKARLQDAALQESAASVGEIITPLGRLVFTIRTKAGLSRADVSERLGKPDEFIEQIEDSQSVVPRISTEEFIGLMQLLRLTFSKVSETVQRTIDSWGFASNSGWTDAIATGLTSNRDESLRFRKPNRPHVPVGDREAAERWLSSLQSELAKRNLTDLRRE
jgi:transcriptional regulator with XRE-family HTH domain